VYETLTMGLVAWFLWSRRHSMRPGGLFALYLVLAGAERFLVEFLRRNDRVLAGLTVPQFIALAMVLAGAVWLLRMRSAGGVPAPARS
jgi:phosphatidylglycerol:prolipoprotein diacylglycerol transferase